MPFGSKTKKKIILTVAVIAGIAALLTVAASFLLSGNLIHRGVFIEDIDVSGLNADEAKQKVLNRISSIYGSKRIEIVCDRKAWSLGFGDISLRFDIGGAVDESYSAGRTGNAAERLYDIIRIWLVKKNIYCNIVYDTGKVKAFISKISREVSQDPVDARVSLAGDKLTLRESVAGKYLDIDESRGLLENNLKSRIFSGMEFHIRALAPSVTSAQIREINARISSFSTAFDRSDRNRSHNIGLACSKLDGTVLMPGEVFSMNKALGSRTIRNGYLDAPVIYKNELIKGPGGGVCQVTTTLYAAALKARLRILERTHHSLPLGYVEPGQDATIAEDYIDMKFENDRDYPICINSTVSEGTINISILGRKKGGEPTSKLRSEVVETIEPVDFEMIEDDSLADDEMVAVREPRNGLRAIVYREDYDENGKLIRQVKISDDTYSPVSAKYRAGCKAYRRFAVVSAGINNP